jgi:tetratricopeptide (TPR) repeat protein
VVNFTLLSTPWNIDQVKRRTYNAMPVPGQLTHDDYRDGVNDQIYIMKPGDWKNIFETLQEKGTAESVLKAFQNYIVKDSMTVKEAVNFIKMRSPEKDEVLKEIFGSEKFEKYNFLPVNKFVIPVNKANALKSGTINAADLPNVVDQITVKYEANTLYKSNLIMFDILANFDWKRSINFSSGGIYDDENIFYLNEYLQFDGFSYRLVPIRTERSSDGEMGRVDADNLYNVVKNFKWGNFKDLNVHFDETATSNIISYRGAASRAAAALALKGDKKRALEILDLASKEIPAEKFNDPRSLSSMVYGYLMAGQEKKALDLAEVLKKGIFEEYDFYLTLSSGEQRNIGRAMKSKPAEYSLVVTAVTDAYTRLGQKQKAYNYLVKSIEPIDKKFNTFVKDLQSMGKEKATQKAEDIQKITPYYQYLFDVMEPFDSTYAKEKENQITRAIMNVTQ